MAMVSITASGAAPQNASPFGLEIGVATCDAARAKLGKVSESKLDGNDVLLEAANPSFLYEGATKLIVRCSDKRVFAVQFEASKGGMGTRRERPHSLAKGAGVPFLDELKNQRTVATSADNGPINFSSDVLISNTDNDDRYCSRHFPCICSGARPAPRYA